MFVVSSRFGGFGTDEIWDRVEEIVRRNFNGSFDRCDRSGFTGHAGYLHEGAEPTATSSASMTTCVGRGTCICNQVEIIFVEM